MKSTPISKELFKCTRCAACCTKHEGVVYLSARDITRLCASLKIGQGSFLRQYCRRFNNQIALAKKGHACILLENKNCSQYNARPKQCRDYPFFEEGTDLSCPGISHA